MLEKSNKYLVAAILIGLVFHGTSIFFTLENSYDALIHLFFAEHYSTSWFEPWSYSWYTGFTVTGYPPLVHQSIALLAGIGGLKFGLFTVAIISVLLFISGVYRYALLLTGNRTVAGYAALLAVFSSSFIETLHVFGQLPSIIGISLLLHTLPEIYNWLKTGRYRFLISAFALLAVTVTSHHVTPIFGMIFFIFPLIGIVLMDASREKVSSISAITFKVFLKTFYSHFKRIVIFGFGSLILIIGCILPYWINTKNNPITQVAIPHGSRDNFIEITSSGLVFFLIPWGILLILLPYFYYRFFSKRYLFFGLSFAILMILGTGGTTPIPLKILGQNAFNILTLDRFTLWATIMILPIFGEFVYRFVEGDLKTRLQNKWGSISHRIIGGILALLFLFLSVFTLTLGRFRPSQPDAIDMLPIVNFLNQDDHDKWRYLPLGFGDQMAWLSAQTNAMTVDGNYHSARRLPELTTRAVERLENSKFRGVEGIGSLQQFLAVPEKYHLKYVFSNDKFYDPILYFSGWHRLQQLENGIMVWERAGIKPLPSVLPKDDIPQYQKIMWGVIPLTVVIITLLLHLIRIWRNTIKTHKHPAIAYPKQVRDPSKKRTALLNISLIWVALVILICCYGGYQFYLKNTTQLSPKNVVKAYYDAIDFKEFERAFSYLDPTVGKSQSQFMLEISVSDGLLSSYAKLDAIAIEVLERNDNLARLKTKTSWITPLETFERTFINEVVKRNNEWFLTPSEVELDIPPDQLFSENKTVFYNHGRRRITTGQTYHEDVLKQPVAEVISARLVKNNMEYAIVGQIQNVDNIPSDIAITGTLYSIDDVPLAKYNAKDVVKHKLLPKEITNFRIKFEGIAWSKQDASKSKSFNPAEFLPAILNESPVKFDLQIESNSAITDIGNQLAIQDYKVINNKLLGSLFNTGIQNATIPQLLVSYYNADKEIIWVEKHYLEESARPQRKIKFDISLANSIEVTSIFNSLDYVYVNGLPNAEISNKVVPSRKLDHAFNGLIAVENNTYSFVSIKVNTYIGNPK